MFLFVPQQIFYNVVYKKIQKSTSFFLVQFL